MFSSQAPSTKQPKMNDICIRQESTQNNIWLPIFILVYIHYHCFQLDSQCRLEKLPYFSQFNPSLFKKLFQSFPYTQCSELPSIISLILFFFLPWDKQIHEQKTMLDPSLNQPKANLYYDHFLLLLRNITESVIQIPPS